VLFKKKKDTQLNLILFTTIVLIIFMVVVSIDMIFIESKSTTTTKLTSYEEYDTSVLNATSIEVNEEEFEIESLCTSGCNLVVSNNGNQYYYVIGKINTNYYLSIITNNKVLLKNKSIGTTIDKSYIRLYHGYVTFFNKILSDSFVYDYVNFVNGESYDEITSLESDEISLDATGVIYYKSTCIDSENYNAAKLTMVKTPFVNNEKEITRVEKNYSWCS